MSKNRIEVKRGASFRVALQFTPDEWESISSVDVVTSEFKQGNRYFLLEAEVNQQLRCIFLRAETHDWKIGIGAFDVKLIIGGTTLILPELVNIQVRVTEGATR